MILYRLLLPLLIPVLVARAVWAVLRGRETTADLRERLWGPRVTGPCLWVHAASVGEVQAARPVIAALAAEGRRICLTITTVTGRDAARGWGMAGVSVGLAPLDLASVTRRMLRRNRITGMIVVENELWPLRLRTCQRAGLPVVMLGARMSERSARVWARFPGLAAAMLRHMALIVPQDADSAGRLARLGARAAAMTDPVPLKSLYAANDAALPDDLRALRRDSTVLAAATHAGEEETALAAFAIARRDRPDLRLILAPRHADRGVEVARIAASAGLRTRRRSLGQPPDAPVYLADTMGEMHLWYRLAGAGFIGGSLVDRGGHTPYEPAAHGCPILHGPHVANFAGIYARLDAGGAAMPVSDAATLAAGWLAHLDDSAMAAAARAICAPADLAPVIARLRAALDPGD